MLFTQATSTTDNESRTAAAAPSFNPTSVPMPPNPALLRDPPAYPENDAIGHVSNVSSATTLVGNQHKTYAGKDEYPQVTEKINVRKSTVYIVDLGTQDPDGSGDDSSIRRGRFRPSGSMALTISLVVAAIVDVALLVMTCVLMGFVIIWIIRLLGYDIDY